jgi:hypothetical protein
MDLVEGSTSSKTKEDAAHGVRGAGNIGVPAINDRDRRKLRMNVLAE